MTANLHRTSSAGGRHWVVRIVSPLLMVVAAGCAPGSTALSRAPSAPPSASPTVTPTGSTPACAAPGGHTPDPRVADPAAPHGLYVLSGALPLSRSTLGPSIQKYLVHNPDVCGGSVFVNWGQVDNGPSSHPRYNWERVDELITPWAQAHKTVSIQLGGTGYEAAVLAGVPSWLQPQLQTVICGSQTAPIYWQSTYKSNWQSFVAAFVQHYENNPSVAYIHVGLGTGAQTIVLGVRNAPACLSKWDAAGYEGQWPAYVSEMISFVASLHASVQLNVSFNDYANYPAADRIAAADAAAGLGFGFSGLQSSDVSAQAAHQVCGQTGANWCALYDQYAGKMPLFVQTLQASYPGPGVSGVTPQIQRQMEATGPLPPLLSMALALNTQIFELYAQDWLLAFDPSYPGYDRYHVATAQALGSAAQVVGTGAV